MTTHKRIPAPLAIQTSTGNGALLHAKQVLEKALGEVTKDIEHSEAEHYVQITHAFGNGGSHLENNILYSAVGRANGAISDLIKKNVPEVDYPYGLVQDALKGTYGSVWNEAVELCAQIVGGTEGTLLRDLKVGYQPAGTKLSEGLEDVK